MVDNGDGSFTNWIGTFTTADGQAPTPPQWIDHAEHGPLYVFADGENVWLYDPNIPADNVEDQFIYTSRAVHPNFYLNSSSGTGNWLFYLVGVEGPSATPRVFADFDGDPVLLSDREYLNIVELASSVPDLSTLVTAVDAADPGVATALSGAGPLTVFAPVNSAFTALGDTLDTLLLPENQDTLTDVLQYHVVDSEITASDLIFDPEDIFSGVDMNFTVTALNGDDIDIEVTGMGAVMLNGSAMVTTPDVFASNGVVHLIDEVLLPPEDLATTAANAGLSSLVATVGEADASVGEALTGDGPLTVFAPTDDAFAAVSDVTDGLSESELTDVLLYHVVPGELTASDLLIDAMDLFNGEEGMFYLTTVNGADLKVEVTPMGVLLNDSAMVTTTDVMASNGVAHVINAVLLPPADLATVATDAGFSELVTAVGDADPAVLAALTGDTDYTVFAPTNAAFQAISDTVDGLTTQELTDILLYHVVPGKIYASEVPLDTPIETVNGATVTFTADSSGALFINGAEITMTNVMAGNGVIHVIDAVITPPAGDS
ncbi:MAG: fasciclin domain-containing protein [Opitutales bacterium]